ncbi:MAG: CoA transferase [Chloroflexi bacterium]|nr:CoA transferase [Chloroflexota bacterium]
MPLSDLLVIDLTRARSGPTCVRQLADWGADVIKIEPPPASGVQATITGGRHGFDFQNLHRNKRSLTLDLKAPEGRQVLLDLAKTADVVVENFRPLVKQRLGIDYETLREANPRIIYASISGFGQSGPYRDRPGFDQIAQGLGGIMSVTGLPGQGPVRAGVPIADLSAGHFLAQGVLLALIERERSGEGQWVHTSLLEAQIAMMDFQAARWLIEQDLPGQAGNDHPTSIPTGVFPTADGHINIAASGQPIYERFCKAIGAPELIERPEYADGQSRSKHRKALNAELAAITSTRISAEWIEDLNEAGVPCGPIYRVDEMAEDEQVRHLRIARPAAHPELGEIELVGQAMQLERTPQPPQMRSAAPALGEHSDEVLASLGYDDETIAGLRERGVV